MLSFLRTLSIVFLLILTCTGSLHAVDPAKALAPHYRHWITEEVPYIISSDERQQFFALKSDAERDNFIQAFWNVRNPSPGSEVNTYKLEHYRRLAYANQTFGNLEAQDGWRTDQGRVYITLGEPQQRTTYPNSRNVRPIAIWFYESPTLALPLHFYVMFYKRSNGDPYTLYSPYQDGPARLMTGLEDLNDQKRSLQSLRKSLGDEVARISLTLIPTEPADLDSYSPSMTSDVLLSQIRGLADNPLMREMLEARRGREIVSSRVLMSATQADLETATFREEGNRQTAYYLMLPQARISDPVSVGPDNKLGYSLTLQTTVTTRTGKRVYQTENILRGAATEEQAKALKEKRFAVEERLPLAPGEYTVAAMLTNNLTHVTLRESQLLVVPDLASEGWGMSSLVAFSQHTSGPLAAKLPFTLAGVRFVPRGVGEVSLHASEPLWLAFQLWSKPTQGVEHGSRQVKITYSYGKLQGGQVPLSESEEIDASNMDASGNFTTGHMISTTELEPGTYRLVVTAIDEATQRKAFSTMSFRIVPWAEPTDLWTAYNTDPGGSRSDAIDDYKRALSALAQSQTGQSQNDQAQSAQAELWLKRSLADDSQYLPALDRWVDLLSREKRFVELAALSADHPVTPLFNERTAILMAEANGQVGQSSAGIRILESEMQVQKPHTELYLALARLYQTDGNALKSQEFRRKAEALKN